MWVAWQLVFGPGTERLTYFIIAPLTTWAVLASWQERRLRALSLAAWLITSLLGTGGVERVLLPYWSLAPAILPLGVVLFVVWLIVRETSWATAPVSDIYGMAPATWLLPIRRAWRREACFEPKQSECALRRSIEAGNVDPAASLFLDELDPRFQTFHTALEKLKKLLVIGLLFSRRTRHRRIAQMPGKGREEEQWVLAAVGHGDLAFLLAEQDRLVGVAGLQPVVFAAHIDHVGEIDEADWRRTIKIHSPQASS